MLKIIKMEYFQQNYNKSCQFSFCHTTQNMNKTFFLMPLTISAASVQLVAKNQIIEKKTARSSFSVMCVFYAVFFTITIANVHMNSQVGVLDLDLWHIPYMPPTSADCGLVRSLLAGWWVGWWAGWPTSLIACPVSCQSVRGACRTVCWLLEHFQMNDLHTFSSAAEKTSNALLLN